MRRSCQPISVAYAWARSLPGTKKRCISELFYDRGINATGVDTVVAAAGVSKPTLYAHFRSKSELVVAVLERRHTRRTQSLQAWVTAQATDPRQGVLAVFDWLADFYPEEGRRGCAFLKRSRRDPRPRRPRPATSAAGRSAGCGTTLPSSADKPGWTTPNGSARSCCCSSMAPAPGWSSRATLRSPVRSPGMPVRSRPFCSTLPPGVAVSSAPASAAGSHAAPSSSGGRGGAVGVALGLAPGPAVALGLARFAYALLLPSMRSDLGWSFSAAGAMNTANAVGYLAGALAAPAARPGGARRSFLAGLALTVMALAASAATGNLGVLFGLRALASAAGAVSFVVGAGLVAQISTRQVAGRAELQLGIYFAGGGTGIIASGLTIPPLLAHVPAAPDGARAGSCSPAWLLWRWPAVSRRYAPPRSHRRPEAVRTDGRPAPSPCSWPPTRCSAPATSPT